MLGGIEFQILIGRLGFGGVPGTENEAVRLCGLRPELLDELETLPRDSR